MNNAKLKQAKKHREQITKYAGLAMQGHCSKRGVPATIQEQYKVAGDCAQMAHMLALRVHKYCATD